MRKVVSILVVLGVLGGFARAYNSRNADFQSPASAKPAKPAAAASDDEGDTKMVDLAADIVYPFDLDNDSSVICLVGNFIGHHNGAVITCDSAVRYGDQRLECFGNVLINKNETYIYGDRADYNGATNRAEVYSQLVKVIDGDATLYTYRFRFDTKLNIGEFGDGGVITNRDNLLEADRGFYYADTREVIGVDQVEIRNDTYQMTGDSVIYNIETDNARFFTRTNIWNDKGEYLYADRGDYDRYEERYVITQNGYILTETREVWSDSLDYYRDTGYALLRHDIQIDDTENKALAFGDWGEYWEEEGNALLTLNPSIISYDAEQGDSLFMRADTIWMHTRSTFRDKEEAEAEKKRAAEEAAALRAAAEMEAAGESSAEDETGAADERSVPTVSEAAEPELLPESPESPEERSEVSEKLSAPVSNNEAAEERAEPVEKPADDSVGVEPAAETPSEAATETVSESDEESDGDDNVDGEEVVEKPLSEMTKEERKAKLREIAEQERAEKKKAAEAKKKAKAKAKAELLEAIAERRQAKKNIQLDKQARRDSIAAAKLKAHEEARKQKMLERLNRKGIKLKWADASVLAEVDSIMGADMLYFDSLAHARLDSILLTWLPDTVEVDSVVVDSSLLDTVYRIVRGYRNVRIYRSDFQAVCDSLASSTLDSVIRMYIEPVMWHQTNQITSEQANIHTKNQQLDFAEFINKPMMISKLDTLHFNQVAGKTMYSYFRDNEIYRDDVDGNAETIYYMQDEKTQELQGMMYITSADMTFYIEGQEITGITYRGNPDYVLYPMDKIPVEQEYFLQGFTWQENRRPEQDSVFTRVLRPSVREEKEALSRPTFPIAKRIESYKERLIERNAWYDRDEKLTDDVIYWLDMNTDWREQNARDKEMREKQRSGSRRAEQPKPEIVTPVIAPETEDALVLESLPEVVPSSESLPDAAPVSAPIVSPTLAVMSEANQETSVIEDTEEDPAAPEPVADSPEEDATDIAE